MTAEQRWLGVRRESSGFGAASLGRRAGGGRVRWRGGRVNSKQVVFVRAESIPGQGRQECDPRCRRETNERYRESCHRLAAQLTRMGTRVGMGDECHQPEELTSFQSPQG